MILQAKSWWGTVLATVSRKRLTKEGGDDDPENTSKWSFQMLREYFEKHGVDYDLVMRRIKDLVVKIQKSC